MHTFAYKPKATQQTTFATSTRPGGAHFGQSRVANPILNLQSTIGNQAVQRLLEVNAEELNEDSANSKASTRFAHDFSRIPVQHRSPANIQEKLTVSSPGDIYEKEADLVSGQVMQMPKPQLQRACACGGGCPKCQAEQTGQVHRLVQTKAVQTNKAGEIAAPPIVHEVLRSPGQPLLESTRVFFEPRFGKDFSNVRVHSDNSAAQTKAFTVGNDVVFGQGFYTPGTSSGRKLLGHELTHVVQQNQHLGIQDSAHAAESETGQAAMRLAMGQPALVHTTVKGGIQRQPISKKEIGSRYKAYAGIEVSSAWIVLNALKKQDPVASPEYQDFKEAFRILNAIYNMPDLLITLTELRHSATGNYLELLISKTEIVKVSDRLVTIMRVVIGSYYVEAIELEENLSSSERADIADYLKRTKTGASEMHLRMIEDLRVGSTTQPQPSQNRGDRVRAAKKLMKSKDVKDKKKAIDAYVALLKDVLLLIVVPDGNSYKVRVAKFSGDYEPGYINFDPAYKKPGGVVPSKPPEKRGELPKKPMLVLGPSSIDESSPIKTLDTLKHEWTHERHYYLLIKCAESWNLTKYSYFGKWLWEVGRKTMTMSEGDYHLIMDMFEEPARDFRIKGITEMLSDLEAFTAYYHLASEENVKESLASRNLSGIAFELASLRPGKAKEYYKKEVYKRLRNYYRDMDKLGKGRDGHRSTFCSTLNDLARTVTKGQTKSQKEQKELYAQWAKFCR